MTRDDIKAIKTAIAQAAKSKSDNPADPKVGAVLLRNSEQREAYRGETGPGHHAEFGLLQKKIRSKDLTQGATLYTTLEPCTTRSHDKLPCADWVIQKGIKRVVIGLLDPNPNICGRGYWRLFSAGITVDLFQDVFAREVAELNKIFINDHQAPKHLTLAFASLADRNKDPRITPYPGFGWGTALSLQEAPERLGWPMSEIELRHDTTHQFVMPNDKKLSYKKYFAAAYEKRRFKDDTRKFMLDKNPTAFSDTPSLSLTVRETKFSDVQYYRDNVSGDHNERSALIDEATNGSLGIEFPHSLCLHTIVVTADRKLLLTKRAPKVSYYPGAWSCSIEENLEERDLKGPKGGRMFKWAKRMLWEELHLGKDTYLEQNLRVLSVFIEADILNVAICAEAEVSLTSSELDVMLRGHKRTDYEFTEWDYLPLEKAALLDAIIRPRLKYHPTTAYRLVQVLLKHFPIPTKEEIEKLTPLSTAPGA